MKTILTSFIISAVLIAMVVISVRAYTSVPIAIFSHSTGQCVKILRYDGVKAPCGELPERYHKEWTQ